MAGFRISFRYQQINDYFKIITLYESEFKGNIPMVHSVYYENTGKKGEKHEENN